MGNTIRFTGLASGMDTESVVKAILTPYQNKIDKLNKNTTLAEWRKDAYKEMSKKIQDFRNNALSKVRFESTLNQSKVEMSQSGAIKVDTQSNLTNGTHKIQVNKVAEAATVNTTTIKKQDGSKLKKDDLIQDINGMPAGSTKLVINNEEIDVTGMTIEQVENFVNHKFESEGKDINFKFDENVGAFIISSKTTGESQEISFKGTDASVLNALGIQQARDEAGNEIGYTYKGKNAEVVYNGGVSISSETNDIEVNGIKFTAVAETTQPVTVSISKDIDGMVKAITNFVNEYNNLLTEINDKLNADSAKGYEPLTDEEKEAMTDKQIEKWEDKIKGSLFRNDSTLKELGSVLRGAMTKDYSGDGLNSECSMLAQIGISSSSWTDRGKLTVDEEKLRKALTENGDDVVKLITTVAKDIENELNTRSSSTELRSYGQYFNDKIQDDNIKTYKKNLIAAKERYDALETMYYKKFTAMENAMNKMNSQSSLFASL